MANIDLYPVDVQTFSGKLRTVSENLNMASAYASKATGIQMKVASRSSIASRISGLKTKSNTYMEKSTSLYNTMTMAVEQFQNADRRLEKMTRNVLDIMQSSMSTLNRVAAFFASFKVSKQASINGIFLSSASLLVLAYIGSIIDRIKNALGLGTISSTDNATTETTTSSTTTATTTTTTTTTPITEPSTSIYTGCVAFNSEKYKNVTLDSNGDGLGNDYSDYMVLENLDPSYCYWQKNKNYSNTSGFSTGGCLSCADACAGSIKDGVQYDPTATWNEEEEQSYLRTKGHTTKVSGSKEWTASQIRSKAYEEIINGNPTVVRVKSTSSSGHSVTVVGVKNGADPNNLTDADFLIMDPADGKIKTLQDYGEGKKVVYTTGSETCLKAPDVYGIRVLNS